MRVVTRIQFRNRGHSRKDLGVQAAIRIKLRIGDPAAAARPEFDPDSGLNSAPVIRGGPIAEFEPLIDPCGLGRRMDPTGVPRRPRPDPQEREG